MVYLVGKKCSYLTRLPNWSVGKTFQNLWKSWKDIPKELPFFCASGPLCHWEREKYVFLGRSFGRGETFVSSLVSFVIS